jgi:hypothetical protein
MMPGSIQLGRTRRCAGDNTIVGESTFDRCVVCLQRSQPLVSLGWCMFANETIVTKIARLNYQAKFPQQWVG